MKRIVLLWSSLCLLALMTLSCNKNRFDFSELNSAEGSGEWKLPIASVDLTLSRLMSQLSSNEFIETDPNGNIKLKFVFEQDPLLSMTEVMRFQDTEVPFTFSFPFIEDQINIDTSILFSHKVELGADSAHLEELKMRTGALVFRVESNMARIDSIIVTSPDVFYPNGDTLNAFVDVEGSAELDLTGAIFKLDEYGLNFNFRIHYWHQNIDDDAYHVNTDIGIRNLDIEYLKGCIDAFEYIVEYDSIYDFSLNNIDGALSLLNASINVQQKNTCDNLDAEVYIDELAFYGGDLPPAVILDHPDPLLIQSGNAEYVNAFDQHFDIRLSAQQTGLRLLGTAIANPGGLVNPDGTPNLITISDTSCISLKVDAEWPFAFRFDNVTYTDTLDLQLSDISSAPEFIKAVRLLIDFESRLPFGIGAQLLAYNSETGKKTEIMNNSSLLAGSYNNQAEKSETVVEINHENLGDFLAADKMIMILGLTTDGHDVQLNLNKNALGMVIKAEVEYGGEIEFN